MIWILCFYFGSVYKSLQLNVKQLFLELKEEFDRFKKEVIAIIAALRKKNAELKERLAKYENPKNSGNSSVAPSQDPFRKTKSLRAR